MLTPASTGFTPPMQGFSFILVCWRRTRDLKDQVYYNEPAHPNLLLLLSLFLITEVAGLLLVCADFADSIELSLEILLCASLF